MFKIFLRASRIILYAKLDCVVICIFTTYTKIRDCLINDDLPVSSAESKTGWQLVPVTTALYCIVVNMSACLTPI